MGQQFMSHSQSSQSHKLLHLKFKVNFEMYIADRKATSCILAKLFLLRCGNAAALATTGTLLLDSLSLEGRYIAE